MTEWDEVKRTMTWSRYNAVHRARENNPSLRHLLTYVAMANGYKPPDTPRSSQEAAEELKRMFPGGMIKSP